MAGAEGHRGECNKTGLEDQVGGRPHGLPADSGRKPMSDSYRTEAKESAKKAYSSRAVIPDEAGEQACPTHRPDPPGVWCPESHRTLQLENHGAHARTHTQLVSEVRRTTAQHT